MRRKRFSVHGDVVDVEVLDPCGVKVIVLEMHIDVFQRNAADFGLTGGALDLAERTERTFDVRKRHVRHNGIRRRLSFQIEELAPRSAINNRACNPLAAVAHGHTLAEAIVDTVREPLVTAATNCPSRHAAVCFESAGPVRKVEALIQFDTKFLNHSTAVSRLRRQYVLAYLRLLIEAIGAPLASAGDRQIKEIDTRSNA